MEATRGRRPEEVALAEALRAAFAAARLVPVSHALLELAAVAATAVWVHSWHALPERMLRGALIAWMVLVASGIAVAIAARRTRARLDRTLPRIRSAARLAFAPMPPGPAITAFLAQLAVPIAGPLVVEAALPGTVPAALLRTAGQAWVVLMASGIAARYSFLRPSAYP